MGVEKVHDRGVAKRGWSCLPEPIGAPRVRLCIWPFYLPKHLFAPLETHRFDSGLEYSLSSRVGFGYVVHSDVL